MTTTVMMIMTTMATMNVILMFMIRVIADRSGLFLILKNTKDYLTLFSFPNIN